METTQKIQIEAKSQQKKSAWYLLTGLIVGVIIGLLYAWLINPIEYQDIDPASLDSHSKDAYRITVAQAYALTGNLSHAKKRLALFDDENPVHTLAQQAQRELGVGNDEEARALALLASALQVSPENQTPIATNTAIDPTTTFIGVPTQTLPALTPVP
jgi:uncharacterized membrane-anchored protein YhcB (DUF1043 family)